MNILHQQRNKKINNISNFEVLFFYVNFNKIKKFVFYKNKMIGWFIYINRKGVLKD